MDVLVTIGVNSPQDVFSLSEEEQALRHIRKVTDVYVHKNYKRARPYDLGKRNNKFLIRI